MLRNQYGKKEAQCGRKFGECEESNMVRETKSLNCGNK